MVLQMFTCSQMTSCRTLIDAGAIAELGGETVDYIKDTNSEAIVDSVTSR